MGSISYYMIGLRSTNISHFLYFLLILILFNIVAGSACICIAAIAPNVASANVITIMVILISSLFGGFLINRKIIPIYLQWMQYISFWNYPFEALMINEFFGAEILIDPEGMRAYPGTGIFILNNLGMSPNRFFIDIIITSLFAIFFLILSAVLLNFFVKEKR
jgi:ABC-type multidrug transport system permease subunit